MQAKDIYSLLEQFLNDGFTTVNLSQITGVPSDLIDKCCQKKELLHEETLELGSKVLSFLSLLYMVDTEDNMYLKDSVSALECFYHLSREAIANYMGMNLSEFECFLDDPQTYPDGHKLSIKLMHFKTVLLQRVN